MKKIILLVVLVLLLCGCTADVDLEITEDTVKESISINYFQDNNITKEQVLDSFREYMPAYNNVVIADTEEDEKQDGVEYYKRSVKDLGTGYNFKYDYDYGLVTYNGARSLKRAFKSASILKNNSDGTITLSTDGNGLVLFDKYDSLSAVNIRIKTTNEVLDTNGTLVDGVYTWKFDKDDYHKNIYMKMKPVSNNDNNSLDGKKKKDSSEFRELINKNPLVSVLVGIGLFFLIIGIMIKISSKK